MAQLPPVIGLALQMALTAPAALPTTLKVPIIVSQAVYVGVAHMASYGEIHARIKPGGILLVRHGVQMVRTKYSSSLVKVLLLGLSEYIRSATRNLRWLALMQFHRTRLLVLSGRVRDML